MDADDREDLVGTIVDANSDEGVLREAHDLLRLARFDHTPVAWVAADLIDRLANRLNGPADVVDVDWEQRIRVALRVFAHEGCDIRSSDLPYRLGFTLGLIANPQRDDPTSRQGDA